MQEPVMDYYAVLKVSPGIGANPIFRAFAQMRRRARNDKERLLQLFTAYQVLTPPCRKYYDLTLHQQKKHGEARPQYYKALKTTEQEATYLAQQYWQNPTQFDRRYARARRNAVGEVLLYTVIEDYVGNEFNTGLLLTIIGLLLIGTGLAEQEYVKVTVGFLLLMGGAYLLHRGYISIARKSLDRVLQEIN